MYDLSYAAFAGLIISGIMIGISKTAVPGFGMVSIPILAMILPARASTGIVLAMLIFADIFAVVYYRRQALWFHLLRLIPFALPGIIIGYLLMGRVGDQQLKYAIGFIILAMLALNFWREKQQDKGFEIAILHNRWFAGLLGLIAGVATMMANAAGPIMVVYLIAMKVPKTRFIGTAAWYFFILNWVKVPFSANLGFINSDSLKLSMALFPAVAAGALAGIPLLKYIPERIFGNLVKILTLAAAVKLFF